MTRRKNTPLTAGELAASAAFEIRCAGPGPHAKEAPQGVIMRSLYDPTGHPDVFCTSSACQAVAATYTG